MKRDNMIIYRSFYEAAEALPPEEYKACMSAVFKYGMDGEETELDGIAKAMFLLMKPVIDSNNTKYENGCKGGRPRKTEPTENQTETKTKPNHNQTETEVEPYEEEEVEEEDIKDIYISAREGFTPPTRDEIEIECIQKGYALDIDLFLSTYQAQGWKLGNGQQVTDWKALLKKWNISQAEKKGRKIKENNKVKPFNNFKQHDYDFDELRKRAKA